MSDFRPMVDTNILVYAHNQDSPHFKKASSILGDLIGKGGFCVTPLILMEFFSVITNGRKVAAPLSPATAINVIDDILESQTISVLETYGGLHFFRWLVKYGQSVKRYEIYDASVAFAMYQNNITELYTNNAKDFKKFNFIQAINPFSDIHPGPRTPERPGRRAF